jgi:hypothetical protein
MSDDAFMAGMSSLPPEQQDGFYQTLRDIGRGSLGLYQKLSAPARSWFLRQAEATLADAPGAGATIEALYSVDYKRIPVDPMTFLTHSDYMGHMRCWPAWRPLFEEVCKPFSGVRELILTGAQGLGKTTFCTGFVLSYKIHRLSCLKDPSRFYGLAPRTQIVFGLYAMTKKQIQRVGFYTLKDQMIGCSPYFQDVFPRVPHGKETISWEQGETRILVETGSERIHAIGRGLFAVVADELNYYDRGEKTAQRARDLVSELSKRLGSRFVQYGGDIPGVACFVSQTRTESDFLEQRIKKMGHRPGVKVVRGPRWAFNPLGYEHRHDPDNGKEGGFRPGCPTCKTFRVFTGTETVDPRILDKVVRRADGGYDVIPDPEVDEAEYPDTHRLEVPVTHYTEFVDDLYDALRLTADVPSTATTPFFGRKEIVRASFRDDLPFPFSTQTMPCYEGSTMRIRDGFNHKAVTGIFLGKHAPIRHPGAPRYIHLDLAQGQGKDADRAGIAMVHPSAHYINEGDDVDDDAAGVGDSLVIKDIECDFYLALEGGPFGQAIDFLKVRMFIEWLRRIGFWVRKVTADSYQSFDMLQRLREAGFITEVLSVDRTSKPYKVVRQVASEGRWALPFPRGYTPADWGSEEEALARVIVYQEILGLEHDVTSDKVDHREKNPDGSKGSKDIADAITGASFSCIMDKVRPGDAPTAGTPRVEMKQRLAKYMPQVQRWLTT